MLEFAFTETGLYKAAADFFEGNTASEAVLKKCGMKYEGTARGKYFKDGRHFMSRQAVRRESAKPWAAC